MTCSIDGCSNDVLARGWCRLHWKRWRRHGNPLTVVQIQGDDKARILSRIAVQPNGCWHWTGQVNANGYGRLLYGGHKSYVHRVAYEVLVGPIPNGLDVGHRCHDDDKACPGGTTCEHRRCCNPEHLVPETTTANRGRANLRGLRGRHDRNADQREVAAPSP